jgi:hypothetical protein
MTQKELTELTDEELLEEKERIKKAKIINATLIGVFTGIIIWSIAKNTWGLVTLIPLFFIYKLVNKSKNDNKSEEILKGRNRD